MLTPFPEEVEVPYGLVNVRQIWGVPVGILGLLLFLGLAPFYLWGKQAWPIAALCLCLGGLVAKVAKDDPQFLKATMGEGNLRDYYD
jgi:hypothetical protein